MRTQIHNSTTVPFELAGGAQPLIVLEVWIGEEGPFRFILDSGAAACVITDELAHRLRVATIATRQAAGAGGAIEVRTGRLANVRVGSVEAEDVDVVMTAELGRIAAAVGTPIDGALGATFLRDLRVTVDYGRRLLRLERGANGALAAAIPFTFASEQKPLPIVRAYVDDEGPFAFGVDTGASITVVSPAVAQQAKLAMTAVPAMTGGGGTVAASASSAAMRVGRAEARGVSVAVSPFVERLSQIIGTRIDGFIGYSFLQHFELTIDYVRREIALGRSDG